MGFRSVAISGDYHIDLPGWFVDKHGRHMHFNFRDLKHASLPMASIYERKFYQRKEDLVFV